MATEKTEFLLTARNETQEAFRSVEAGLGKVSSAIGAMLPQLAALAGVAGFGSLIKSQIDVGDQLAKMSQKFGIAVEDLSAYQYAAKLSDLSNEQLSGGLAHLTKAMIDTGNNAKGPAAAAFRALNIEVRDSTGNFRPLNQVLDEVGQRFAETRDGTNKTAAAIAFFGESGTKMTPFLNSMRAAAAEARRTGAIVSTEFAQKSEQFKDSMTRMETAAGNLARTLAGPLVKALGGIVERMSVAVGAQESLSIDLLKKDKEFLQVEYGAIMQAAEKGYIVNTNRAETLKKQIDEIDAKIAAAQAKASAAAASFGTAGGGMPDMPSIVRPAEVEGIGDREAKQSDKYESELARQVAALQLSTAPMAEQLQMKLETQQMITDAAWQAGLINDQMWEELDLQTRQVYEDRKTEMEAQYLEKRRQAQDAARATEYGAQFAWQGQINALMQGSFNQQLQGTGQMLGQLSTLMQSSKKKEFEFGKKAAIGEALVNTYLGVSSALAMGFPVGLIFAAIQLAVGMANVNRIRSQKFGGGGGATGTFPAAPGGGFPTQPSGGAGEPALPPPTLPGGGSASQQPRQVNITISGSARYTAEEVRDLIGQINEQGGYGANVRTVMA